MSETRWTPGPWAVQLAEPMITSRATAFEVVTDDFDVVGGRVAIRSAADAHLIAAAPDLYEALERCRNALKIYAQEDCIAGGNGLGCMSDPHSVVALPIEQADAALAKARGEKWVTLQTGCSTKPCAKKSKP